MREIGGLIRDWIWGLALLTGGAWMIWVVPWFHRNMATDGVFDYAAVFAISEGWCIVAVFCLLGGARNLIGPQPWLKRFAAENFWRMFTLVALSALAIVLSWMVVLTGLLS